MMLNDCVKVSMSRTACLIFNPVAGRGDSRKDLNQIEMLLSPEIDLDVQLTTPEIGADLLANSAIERQVETIIVSGGDGTVSAVANAMTQTDIPLRIIPRGTANAFAKALNISDNLAIACQTILDGKTKTIDLAKCNGNPMVLMVGIGFKAEATENTSRQHKDRFGTLGYILAGLQQLLNWQEFEARIETDNEVFSTATAAVTIANAAFKTSILAQGAAEVVPDDGLLDITIVSPKNSLGFLVAFYDLYRSAINNRAAKHKNISYLRSRKVRISTDPPQKVVVDGEVVDTTPIEVECLPQSLTIYGR